MRPPGKGTQEADPLLEAALPFATGTDCLKAAEYDNDEGSDDEDQEIKEARTQRIRKTGGWLGYLKDFTVFLPYIIPREDIKVQLYLLVCIITVILERALRVVLPGILGIITDKVTSGIAHIRELVVLLVLDILYAKSGVLFIQELSKIPIKQCSYKKLTNAAFSQVMSQSIDFHSTQDSAEIMKTIGQGGALGNVLESVVIDISPTFIDVIIACVIFDRKFSLAVAMILLGASTTYLVAEALSSQLTTGDRRKVTKAERLETRKMHQAVQGWQTVVYFNQYQREARTLMNAVTEHMKAKTRF